VDEVKFDHLKRSGAANTAAMNEITSIYGEW